jgi:copper chaperone CopZ
MTYFLHAATLGALAFFIYQNTLIGKAAMATQNDVDALTAQVVKIGSEVQNVKVELAKVQAQVDALGVPVDLTALTNAIQSVDDLNPDAQPAGDTVTDA